MTTPLVRRPLTDTELARIKTAIDDADSIVNALVAALTETFNALLADLGKTFEDFDADHPLDGQQYLIPSAQWGEIGEYLQARTNQLSDSLDTVNIMLSWMNSGPSGYGENGH